MDPNAARSTMIEKANTVLAQISQLADSMDPKVPSHLDPLLDTAMELAEAVHDLDEWLRAGGFLPDVWDIGTMRNLRRKQDVDV